MPKEKSYVERLGAVLAGIEITHRFGTEPDGVEAVCRAFRFAKANKRKVWVIGNGGSATIASHVAVDLSKNAQIPAMALNDPAALTCLSNDFGYEQVFAKQIAYHALPGDVLVAISSSGGSANIIIAVEQAIKVSMAIPIITFSGFDSNNQLRTMGDVNFYVPSKQYGFVELAHMILLHEIIDKLVGCVHALLPDNGYDDTLPGQNVVLAG